MTTEDFSFPLTKPWGMCSGQNFKWQCTPVAGHADSLSTPFEVLCMLC